MHMPQPPWGARVRSWGRITTARVLRAPTGAGTVLRASWTSTHLILPTVLEPHLSASSLSESYVSVSASSILKMRILANIEVMGFLKVRWQVNASLPKRSSPNCSMDCL